LHALNIALAASCEKSLQGQQQESRILCGCGWFTAARAGGGWGLSGAPGGAGSLNQLLAVYALTALCLLSKLSLLPVEVKCHTDGEGPATVTPLQPGRRGRSSHSYAPAA
jgi:hypothetical protein